MPRFAARIQKNWIMRIAVVPAKIVRELGGGSRIPVVAHYCGEKLETHLIPAGGGRGRFTLLMSVLRPAGLDAGDRIEVELTPRAAPGEPLLPPDLQRAFQFRPAALAWFERSAPSTHRWVIRHLAEAKKPETRANRIENIVERFAAREAEHQARSR